MTAKPTQENLNRLADFYSIDPEELWSLAEHDIATRLPAAGPYFRSRYKLPNEAVAEMESYLSYIQQKYQAGEAEAEGDARPKPRPGANASSSDRLAA